MESEAWRPRKRGEDLYYGCVFFSKRKEKKECPGSYVCIFIPEHLSIRAHTYEYQQQPVGYTVPMLIDMLLHEL
jgi:hypothetical protein